MADEQCIPQYHTGSIINDAVSASLKSEGSDAISFTLGTDICDSLRLCNGALVPGIKYALTLRVFTSKGFSDTKYITVALNEFYLDQCHSNENEKLNKDRIIIIIDYNGIRNTALHHIYLHSSSHAYRLYNRLLRYISSDKTLEVKCYYRSNQLSSTQFFNK